MATADNMIRVRLTGSYIGCNEKQRGTLRGLGLMRRGRCSVLRVSPEVLGMIAKVRHLVKVED
ncbi:MAG: 50S ribosomal protein L30 [Candidatus Binatia bacterium]